MGRRLRVGIAAVFVCVLAARGGEKEPPRVAFDLKDGTRVVSEILPGMTIRLRTAYGECLVPLADVTAVTFGKETNGSVVRTRDMRLVGEIRDARFEVKSPILGKLTLKAADMKRIKRAASPGSLAGTWQGTANDKPGEGNSTSSFTLIVPEDPVEMGLQAKGSIVEPDGPGIREVVVEDGKLMFTITARDGQLRVTLSQSDDDPDELTGEGQPVNGDADPRDITLRRQPNAAPDEWRP